MIKINLLSPEIAKKAEKRKLLSIILLCGIAILGLLFLFLGIRIAKERAISAELVSKEKTLAKYKITVEQVKQIEAVKAAFQKKRNLIDRLMKGRLLYPHFMEHFLSTLPPGVWLSAMNVTQESTMLKLTLTCTAFDNFSIADFITNLEASGRFRNVDLGAITTNKVGAYEVQQFQLTCEYQIE